MNQPATYNKAVIPNSPIMTDELNTNSTIATADLQNNDNQAVTNSPITIGDLEGSNSSVTTDELQVVDNKIDIQRECLRAQKYNAEQLYKHTS